MDMYDAANKFVAAKKAEGERPTWDLIRWAFAAGGKARLEIERQRMLANVTPSVQDRQNNAHPH